jgi:hypothetical protein
MSRSSRPRQPGEVSEQLRTQFGFLTRRIASFDEGHEKEAVALAGVCRVLFSDSGGMSVIKQLGARTELKLPDTAILDWSPVGGGIFVQVRQVNPDGSEGPLSDSTGGLAELNGLADDLRWIAPLDDWMDRARWMGLDEWLTKPAVRGSSGTTYSRQDFIRVLANQEGGMHFAPTVDSAYAKLRDDTMGAAIHPLPGNQIMAPREEFVAPGLNVVEASMRQISHEVQRGLEDTFGATLSGSE